jgi:hypothetical protein
MTRTTIVLPEELKRRSVEKARAEGISFAAFVRHAVELSVNEPPSAAAQRNRLAALQSLRAFRDGGTPGPADLTKNLDDYLYGESGEKQVQ